MNMTALNSRMVCARTDLRVPSGLVDALLPEGAHVVCVRMRGNNVEVWTCGDPARPLRQRHFRLVPLVLEKALPVATTSPLALLGVVEFDANFPPLLLLEELEATGEALQATAASIAAPAAA
jgi:hypothetical protein